MNLPDSVWAALVQICSMSTWAVLLAKITVLLAIAWLIHFTLTRANPRWRVLLWRGVAIGLALLVVWSFGLPDLEIRVPAPQPSAMIPSPSLASVVDEVAPVGLPQSAVLPTEVPTSIEMPTTAHQPSADTGQNAALPLGTPEPSLSWQAILLRVWGFGVALLLVRLAIGHLRLARLLPPASQAAPDWVLAEVQRVADALACRRAVEVRSSRQFAMPFLYGLRGPILVLPERMCQPDYRSQLPGIIAHELAHVRSWDFAWNVGLQMASILLWFHPLAWRIGLAHRAACEAVCDAAAASYLGDVQVYCRTLARVALEGAGSFPAAGLAMARTCDVRRRVATLQRMVFAMPLRRRAVAMTALVSLVAAALLACVRLTLAQSAAATTDDQAAVSSEAKHSEDSPKDQSGLTTDTEGSAKPGFRPMRIHVLDSDRKPIVDAGITLRAMTSLPYGPVRYRTNAEGIGAIELPEHDSLDLQLLIYAQGRVTVGAHWKGGSIPAEFSVTMEPGTTFGGIIRNEQGQPIAGADVTVNGRKQSRDGVLWWSINETSRTDTEGKWHCGRVPADLKGFDVSIKVRHPDYAIAPNVDLKTLSLDELRSQNAVMVMHEGIVVEGTVTDPQGKPLPGAAVGLFAERSGGDFPRTKTDQDGHYHFAMAEPGEYNLAAAAKDYAPDSRSITMETQSQTVDLQLRKGEMIRLRVVDEEGKPIPGVTVSMSFNNEYRDALMLDYVSSIERGEDRNLVADAEGRWSRLWIPKDELQFIIRKDGYGQVQKRFAPSEQERVVTLEAGGWSVAGRVVDKQIKAPVTKFRVVEGSAFGSGDNDMSWRERRLVENENGQYRAAWDTSGDSRRVLRIEADGYLPSEARRLKPDEREVTFNVELSKGQAITGTVHSADGEPLGDAQVALCTATRGLYLKDGRPLQGQSHLIVRTGPEGRFSLPAQREPYVLVVLHDQGFAQVEGEQDTKEITIRPWARAEGTLRIGNRPGAKEMIRLDFSEPLSRSQDLSPLKQIARRIRFDYTTQTDAEGHFVFERVVPRTGQVTRCAVSKHGQMSAWIPTHSTKAEFVAGETTQVELSRNGRPVAGKLTMPEDSESVPNWSFVMISLSLREAGPPAPEVPWPKDLDREKDREAIMEWWEEWKETPEGKRLQEEMKQYHQNMQKRQVVHYGTKVEADGSFTFDDIPAGDYQLSAHLLPPPSQSQVTSGRAIATLGHRFIVAEMSGGRSDQPLQLGTLPMKPLDPR